MKKEKTKPPRLQNSNSACDVWQGRFLGGGEAAPQRWQQVHARSLRSAHVQCARGQAPRPRPRAAWRRAPLRVPRGRERGRGGATRRRASPRGSAAAPGRAMRRPQAHTRAGRPGGGIAGLCRARRAPRCLRVGRPDGSPGGASCDRSGGGTVSKRSSYSGGGGGGGGIWRYYTDDAAGLKM